jgi:hypothetical protein
VVQEKLASQGSMIFLISNTDDEELNEMLEKTKIILTNNKLDDD